MPDVASPAPSAPAPATALSGPSRHAWAEVDLAAVRHNAGVLAALAAPAALCAVVKAGAYGHGAVPVALAALDGGASWLAVALVEEGASLRAAGISAPVLLLSEPPAGVMADAARLNLTPTIYTRSGVEAASRAAAAEGRALPVHVKIDTGMHRVGASPAEALDLAADVAADPGLRLGGVWTHLAAADEPDQDAFTAEQLGRFEAALAALSAAGLHPGIVHAANSSGLLAHPRARHDLVRCGITLYGHPPSGALAGRAALRPVLSLKARVSLVRRLPAGETVSYGRAYAMAADGVVATVPLGYADGVPRRYAAVGGEVLIAGRRRPVVGRVTMDQLLVDCGDDAVAAGDEVVLIGAQGGEEITAEEWGTRLATVSYEVLCGISGRVPRRYVDGAGGKGAGAGEG